jgi:hypothetical protein
VAQAETQDIVKSGLIIDAKEAVTCGGRIKPCSISTFFPAFRYHSPHHIEWAQSQIKQQ